MRSLACAAVAACLCGIANAGTLSLVTDRASIGGDDHLYWGQVAPIGDHPTSPVTIESYGGINAVISQPGAAFTPLRQETIPPSYPIGTGAGYNFTVGDVLLSSTLSYTSPMTITFASDISAAGMQIASAYYGAFTVQIEAFTRGGLSLGAVTRDGYSQYTADGTAIFAGVSDTVEEIASIRISLVDPAPGWGQQFVIGTLSFASTKSVPGTNPDRIVQAIPEPSSLSLLSLSALALLAARRRKA